MHRTTLHLKVYIIKNKSFKQNVLWIVIRDTTFLTFLVPTFFSRGSWLCIMFAREPSGISQKGEAHNCGYQDKELTLTGICDVKVFYHVLPPRPTREQVDLCTQTLWSRSRSLQNFQKLHVRFKRLFTLKYYAIFLMSTSCGPAQTAEQLRDLAALAENWSWDPKTHIRQPTAACDSSFRDPTPFSDLGRH